jgi:hypothetical protein
MESSYEATVLGDRRGTGCHWGFFHDCLFINRVPNIELVASTTQAVPHKLGLKGHQHC